MLKLCRFYWESQSLLLTSSDYFPPFLYTVLYTDLRKDHLSPKSITACFLIFIANILALGLVALPAFIVHNAILEAVTTRIAFGSQRSSQFLELFIRQMIFL